MKHTLNIMIKIAICDDNEQMTIIVESLINSMKTIAEVNIIRFTNGTQLIEEIRNNIQYDLIYLDVEMPMINGIQVAHEIRKIDKNCLIIFMTAYLEYASTAFEVSAFRFLSKPIDEEKFKEYYKLALNKIIDDHAFFNYSFKRQHFRVPVTDIIYFESIKRITYIVTETDLNKSCYIKLNDIEKTLLDVNCKFYRANQSFLVNPEQVYAYMHSHFILKNGMEINISASRRMAIKESFLDKS